MKKLIILRGLPGSGKSTWVKRYAQDAVVCSADHYFIKSGEYSFSPKELTQAHQACQTHCKEAMAQGKFVVVDNTNISRWEFEPYVKLAKEYNYSVIYITVGGRSDRECRVYAARNSHGVPLEAIRRMASRWED